MSKVHQGRRANRGTLLAAGAAVGLLAGCASPPPPMAHADVLSNVRTVAVLPFVDAPGPKGQGSGQVIVNAAVAELYKCPGIQVVESARLKAILDEVDLKIFNDPQVASRIGKRAGADVVFLGEVTQYDAQQEYGSVRVTLVSGASTKYTHRVGLSVRAVAVADSRVVYAELGQGTSDQGFSPAAKAAAEEALRSWRRFYEARNAARK